MSSGGDWWASSRTGTLPPVEQAKLWALTTLADTFGVKLSLEKMASVLKKNGGGHPSVETIRKWKSVFQEDPDWYPGKTQEDAATPGPKPVFTPQRKHAVASAAMAEKRAGREPTVAGVRARCPSATWNENTEQPITDKYILHVFREQCYDDDSEQPWGHMVAYNKTALSPAMMELRLAWANEHLRHRQPDHWFFRNVIWLDPCSTILSEGPRAAFDEKHASYGKGKRWMSPDSRMSSRNLRAAPYATKQSRWGDKRVWWFIILARGVAKLVAMPDEFTQTGEGMAILVGKLPEILKSMLGNDVALPRVVFTDRGPGFYQGSTGHIVKAYETALRQHGFRAFAGPDASAQPADIPDCLPHETAVAWARNFMKKRPLKRGTIASMEAHLAQLLSDAGGHITENYDVDALCRGEFNKRMRELKAQKGGRLKY